MRTIYSFLLIIHSVSYIALTSCDEPPTRTFFELNDITNPPGGYINEIGINSHGDFFAATHEGLFISTDRGTTWWSQTRLIDTGTGVTELKITSDDYIFISFYKMGARYLLRSSNNGYSWTTISSTIESIREIEEDSGGNIYIAGNGLYKSSDNGDNWEILYNSSHVHDVIFPDNNSIVIGISTAFPGQILYSSDKGNTWDSIGYQINVAHFFKMDSLLFAGGVSGELGGGGIHKSIDGGKSWSLSGLNDANTTQFILNTKKQLIIGTGYGMFYTSDFGESWQQISGIGPVAISFAKDNYGFLYTGTTSGTFLRSTDNGMTWHN